MADGKFTLLGDVQLKLNPSIKREIASLQNMLNSVYGKMGLSAPIVDERELEKAVRGIKKIDTQITQTETRLERFGKHLSQYFTRFASFTLAASGVFKVLSELSKATDAALEFDNRLVRLQQITGSTRTQLADLTKETFRLATGLGVSQASLTNAAETLAQAGYNAKQTQQALEALAKAEVAPTFKNMEETTDGLIATLNQFNKKTTESEKLLSQLNAVAAAFAVESSDLIKGIQRTGGVFAQSGAQLEEFLALFTAVRATTREAPETIAQGLKTIATRLQRTSTDEFLKRLGIHGIRDAATKEFVGVYKAIEILSNGIKNFSKGSPELAALIEELGGVRQVGKVLPLLNNFTTAQKALQVAQSGSNSLTRDSIIAQESLTRQFAKTREEFQKLITSFMEKRGIRDFIHDILELTNTTFKLIGAFDKVRPYLAIISALRIGRGAAELFKGIRTDLSSPTKSKPFAGGGRVPGRGTKDDFPAMLMRGEYVVSKKGVDNIGISTLDMINKGQLPKFAGGTPGGTKKTSSQKKYNKEYEAKVEVELRRIMMEQSNKQLSTSAILPHKVDQYRKRAERTVLNREARGLLKEADRLNTLELTGINNPIKVRGLLTKSIDPNSVPLNVGDLENDFTVSKAKPSTVREDYYKKRKIERLNSDRVPDIIPSHRVNALVGDIPGIERTSVSETYKRLRQKDPTLSAKDAYRQANNLSQKVPFKPELDPIDNLTRKEKAKLLPVLKQQHAAQIAIYEEAIKQEKEAKKQSSLFSRISRTTRKIYDKTTEAHVPDSDRSFFGKLSDKVTSTRFRKKIAGNISGASTALLLASNTDLFNNTLENLSGSGEKGAAAGGAVRGGLTGLAIGASFGPLGAAAGALTGALIGASQAASSFKKDLEEKRLGNANQSFETDPRLETLIEKINAVSSVAGSRLYEENFNIAGRTGGLESLSFAEAEKINRETFLEESIKNNIPQNIDKVIKTLIDSKQIKTVEDLASLKTAKQEYIGSEIQGGKQSILTKDISLFDILSKGTNKTAGEKQKEYEAYLKNRKELDELSKTVTVLKQKFVVISTEINKFSSRIDSAINSLPDTNIRTISDPQSLVNQFRGLAKTGTTDFAKSVSELPISAQDKQLGFAANNARFALRNTLERANPNTTSENFMKFFRESLTTQLGNNNPMVTALENAMSSIDEGDFTKFAEKLRHGVKEPLEELLGSAGITRIENDLQKAGNSFSQFTSSILKNTETLYSNASAIAAERTALATTSLQNKRTIDSFYGRSTTAGLDNAAIMGGVGAATGTSNVDSLMKLVSGFDRLAESDIRYAEASKYVISNLKRLGDVSSRTGDIMTRLNEVERSRAAKISLRESFITGSPESRRELSMNLGAASGFVKSGGTAATFGALAPMVQKAVLQGLRSFGDATVAGTGKSGNKIAEDLLGAGLPETKEKDTLIASFGKIVTETEKINNFLLTRMESINVAFIRDYGKISFDLLSGLSGVFSVSGRTPIRRASGGIVPGSGNTDSVRAWLMPGEYVLNKRAVQNIGVQNLDRMNKNKGSGGNHFANGGVVTPNVNMDTSALDKFNNLFGINVEKLSQAAASIPHTISMNVNHKLEVIFNGAQVFAELQPSFAQLAQTMINSEINRLIKEKLPDVGTLN